MDIYAWSRALSESGNRLSHARADNVPTPQRVTVNWNGAATPLLVEAVAVYDTHYLTFRPIGAPESEALVVGEDASMGDDFGNTDAHADAFGFHNAGALRPMRLWTHRGDDWLADAALRIERGWYGRLEFEDDQDRRGGVWMNFYAASGHSMRIYDFQSIMIGMMMEPGFWQLAEPRFDPAIPAAPWCDAAQAPELLRQLSGGRIAQWVSGQEQDPTTPAGFARAWKSWSHAERRLHLPPLEREIEDEVCQLMKWAFWSDPGLLKSGKWPSNLRHRHQWFHPRFVVVPESDAGHTFFKARFFGEPHGSLLQDAQTRLEAIWRRVEDALTAERIELSEARAALPPSVAHWCFGRGAYAVTFGEPTNHEQIESRLALREWLGTRANADLESIERAL